MYFKCLQNVYKMFAVLFMPQYSQWLIVQSGSVTGVPFEVASCIAYLALQEARDNVYRKQLHQAKLYFACCAWHIFLLAKSVGHILHFFVFVTYIDKMNRGREISSALFIDICYLIASRKYLTRPILKSDNRWLIWNSSLTIGTWCEIT